MKNKGKMMYMNFQKSINNEVVEDGFMKLLKVCVCFFVALTITLFPNMLFFASNSDAISMTQESESNNQESWGTMSEEQKGMDDKNMDEGEKIQDNEEASIITVSEIEEKNKLKEEFTSEELKKAKEEVKLQAKPSLVVPRVTSTFVYSADGGMCVTMNLYNPDTLQAHSYIDCLGYLMEYLGTNPKDGNYVDIRYQGGIHAIEKTKIRNYYSLSQIKSFPYYINSGGYVDHYIERNPELSNSYIYISTLGKAPQWMVPGVKYYSFSGIYFTDAPEKLGNYSQQSAAINAQAPYYDYYQYLPLRTKTSYTGAQLSQAFQYFYSNSGFNGRQSKMLGTGDNFVEAQNRYGANALLVMAMGIHESAYGTSNFAINRNNLFGVGAVDSDPGQAATFPSIREGIMEQGNMLSWIYMDSDYASSRNYYGANLGNKASGMNVKYASDPFWGEKIGSHAAKIDRYLGELDYQKYGLSIASQATPVYWNNNGTNQAFAYKNSTSLLTYMYPVVTFDNNPWTKVAMEPPYNGSFVVPSQRYPDGGAYNFGYNGFIDRSRLIKINDGKQQQCTSKTVVENDIKYYLRDDCSVHYAERITNGIVTQVFEFRPGAYLDGRQSAKILFVFNLDANKTIKRTEQWQENTGLPEAYYEYYPDTKYGENHGRRIMFVFTVRTDRTLIRTEGFQMNTGLPTAYYEYYPGTKYGENHGYRIMFVFHVQTDRSLIHTEGLEINTGRLMNLYYYSPGTKYGENHGNRIIRIVSY